MNCERMNNLLGKGTMNEEKNKFKVKDLRGEMPVNSGLSGQNRACSVLMADEKYSKTKPSRATKCRMPAT